MKEKITIHCKVGHWAKRLSASQSARTEERFTHLWKVYVQGKNGPLEKFIDKVVFKLHHTFKNPVQTIYEPPYELEECGFGTFPMIIELHFQEQVATFEYDLMLMTDRDINCASVKSFSITNPKPEEFRQKLLDAGGIVVPLSESCDKKDKKHSDKKQKKSIVQTNTVVKMDVTSLVEDPPSKFLSPSVKLEDVVIKKEPLSSPEIKASPGEKIVLKITKTPTKQPVVLSTIPTTTSVDSIAITSVDSLATTLPTTSVASIPSIVVSSSVASQKLDFDNPAVMDNERESSSKPKKKKKHKQKHKRDDESKEKLKKKKKRKSSMMEDCLKESSPVQPDIFNSNSNVSPKSENLPFKKRKYEQSLQDDISKPSTSSDNSILDSVPLTDTTSTTIASALSEPLSVVPEEKISSEELYDKMFGTVIPKIPDSTLSTNADPSTTLFNLPVDKDFATSSTTLSTTDATMESLFGSKNPELPPTLEAEPPTLSPHLHYSNIKDILPAELTSQLSVESTGFRPSIKSSRSSMVSYNNSPSAQEQPATPSSNVPTLESNSKYSWNKESNTLSKADYDNRFNLCLQAASACGNARKEEEIIKILAKASSSCIISQDNGFANFDLTKLDSDSLKKLTNLLLPSPDPGLPRSGSRASLSLF